MSFHRENVTINCCPVACTVFVYCPPSKRKTHIHSTRVHPKQKFIASTVILWPKIPGWWLGSTKTQNKQVLNSFRVRDESHVEMHLKISSIRLFSHLIFLSSTTGGFLVSCSRLMWRKCSTKKFNKCYGGPSPCSSCSDTNGTTVTHGTLCAPYPAISVLNQLAKDEEVRFPLGAKNV